MIALSQQDAQTDANDASDSYPHAIGFHRDRPDEQGGQPHARRLPHPLLAGRAAPLVAIRQLAPGLPPHRARAVGSRDVLQPDARHMGPQRVHAVHALGRRVGARGRSSPSRPTRTTSSPPPRAAASGKTAGGRPNFADSWTQNPQIRLTTTTGGSIGVGVLSISMPEQELRKFQMKHEQLEAAGRTEEILSIGIVVIPIAEQPTGEAPPALPPRRKRASPRSTSG